MTKSTLTFADDRDGEAFQAGDILQPSGTRHQPRVIIEHVGFSELHVRELTTREDLADGVFGWLGELLS